MNFEWDEGKNQSNTQKHGVDFNEVIDVFEHPMLVNLDKRVEYEEDRWVCTGMMSHHVIVVVYTELDSDVIRIISARKANKREVQYYVKNI